MDLREISKKLKALSDPGRLKILYLMRFRPLCVCELTELLGLTQPTISRHLQKLEEAGFVKPKKHKIFQIYALSPKDTFTETLLDEIFEALKEDKELKQLAEAIKNKKPYYPGE